jgi:hypothetical protein
MEEEDDSIAYISSCAPDIHPVQDEMLDNSDFKGVVLVTHTLLNFCRSFCDWLPQPDYVHVWKSPIENERAFLNSTVLRPAVTKPQLLSQPSIFLVHQRLSSV